MKILLLSDTHGYMDDAILSHIRNADEVWHAGDFGTIEVANKIRALKPLRGVWGNIDGRELRSDFPLDNRFTINDLNIWITHIGGYPGHYDKRVNDILKINCPDIFICGHSHILKVLRDHKLNILCMNPGAAGIYGFHKMRTMLCFEINEGKIENLAAIELGLRGKVKP